MEYKQCRYCGRNFVSGKGVNKKGKKYTIVGLIFTIFTFGFGPLIWTSNFQKYCSRECWLNDK